MFMSIPLTKTNQGISQIGSMLEPGVEEDLSQEGVERTANHMDDFVPSLILSEEMEENNSFICIVPNKLTSITEFPVADVSNLVDKNKGRSLLQ